VPEDVHDPPPGLTAIRVDTEIMHEQSAVFELLSKQYASGIVGLGPPDSANGKVNEVDVELLVPAKEK
jgi:hypothetical protein